jgi:hypothetical protein
MIATIEHKGRKFKVGEFDDGKVAFDACQRFIAGKGWNDPKVWTDGWNGCKMSFENTEDDMETTMKI